MSALGTAHTYVRKGWGVVPLFGVDGAACRCRAGAACPAKSRGKHPSLGMKWQTGALTSGPDVEAWWEDHPHDNVGILTGQQSGLFVLDVDGASGVASVSAMATEHGAFPATRIVSTGSGGLHYYFRHPGHFRVYNSTSWLAKGIDIRGVNGQVVAPPSVGGLGSYDVLADLDVAEAPEWLLTSLHEHSNHIEGGRKATVVSAERVELEFMPPALETLRSTLVGEDQGRHKHFHALVAACFEGGYTQGQAVTIAAPWCAAVGKFTGRVEQEVARSWGKLEAEAAKAEEWLPGSTGTAAVPGPAVVADVQMSAAGVVAPQIATSGVEEPDKGLGEEAAVEMAPTWAAMDLEAVLSGAYAPEVAELFTREDGPSLLYRGRVHSFHGESESGKSLIAQAECASILKAGGTAAYLDFESDLGAVVGRLLELGASADQIRAGFEYRRPDADPRKFPHERGEYGLLLGKAWDLVVIDGMTDALSVFGAGSNDNDEITAFMRVFPRLVARRTGAAVVIVDHVTKDSETRGRHAVGGQAKMNALDGAAYVISVEEALGRGLCGVVVMRVGKDRPGNVRPHCGTFAKDRTQEAARVVIDSTGGDGIKVSVGAPLSAVGDASSDTKERGNGRDTTLMEKISRLLEDAPRSQTALALELGFGSNKRPVAKAAGFLVLEGFIRTEGKAKNTVSVTVRPYRSEEDSASSDYLGWVPRSSSRGPSVQSVQIGAMPSSAPIEDTEPQTLRSRGSGSAPIPDGNRPIGATPVVAPSTLVECVRCGGHTTAGVAARWDGACWPCAQRLGLAPA